MPGCRSHDHVVGIGDVGEDCPLDLLARLDEIMLFVDMVIPFLVIILRGAGFIADMDQRDLALHVDGSNERLLERRERPVERDGVADADSAQIAHRIRICWEMDSAVLGYSHLPAVLVVSDRGDRHVDVMLLIEVHAAVRDEPVDMVHGIVVHGDRSHEPHAIMVAGAYLVHPVRQLPFRDGTGKMVTWSQNELLPEPCPIFDVLEFLEDEVRLEQDLPILVVVGNEIEDDLFLGVIDLLHEIIGLHSLRHGRMEFMLLGHDGSLIPMVYDWQELQQVKTEAAIIDDDLATNCILGTLAVTQDLTVMLSYITNYKYDNLSKDY